MSNDIEEQILVDLIDMNSVTELEISDILLYQGTWFWVDVVDDWGCNTLSAPELIENLEKEYLLNEVLGKNLILDKCESDFIIDVVINDTKVKLGISKNNK